MLVSDFIPAREQDSRRLLVALHGLGDSIEGYRWLPEMLALPWLNYRLVNAPDPYYGGYSWYDFAADAAPGIERSRQLIFKLLDELRGAGFPTDQTVLFGFSQGSLMTIDTGIRYPHRFAGLIGISGYVHQPEQVTAVRSNVALEQRFLLTHGTHDPLIPIGPVRTQVDQLKAAGLHIEWREFAKEHTIAGDAELAVIRDFIRGRF
ncbi:MAG: serine esterase [Verrucomicrobiota bacterium]